MASVLIENISRRSVLAGLASLGGFVLATRILPIRGASAEAAAKYGAEAMPHGTVSDPHVFAAIANDGTVTIVCHRSEMGQAGRTGIPIIVADELEAEWARVKIARGPGADGKSG